MNHYPAAVAAIVKDYLERVQAQLRLVPASEGEEFLREIQSHIYEAYRETPGDDDAGVTRILVVLRNLGEPVDVVSDRLPGAMVRSGTRRNLPLQVLGGILIALFGIPLGFGGVAVLAGVLLSLAGFVAAFYATLGAVFLTGALLMLLGLARTFRPDIWDGLVRLGVIQMEGRLAEVVDQWLGPTEQGFVLLLVAAVLLACGLGMLWLGQYLLRGLRFLFTLAFDRVRRLAEMARKKFRPGLSAVRAESGGRVDLGGAACR